MSTITPAMRAAMLAAARHGGAIAGPKGFHHATLRALVECGLAVRNPMGGASYWTPTAAGLDALRAEVST